MVLNDQALGLAPMRFTKIGGQPSLVTTTGRN